MNRVQAEEIAEWIKLAYEVAEETLGKIPPHTFSWSNHMTSCAGMVQWRQYNANQAAVQPAPALKLSRKIFSAAVENLGLENACQKVYEVMIHELAHLYAGPEGRDKGHSYGWEENMEKLGLNPREHRYHDMAWGKQLVPEDLRNRYRLGRKFRFLGRDNRWHRVLVVKHNVKNCKAKDLETGLYWNLPWTWLEQFGGIRVGEI